MVDVPLPIPVWAPDLIDHDGKVFAKAIADDTFYMIKLLRYLSVATKHPGTNKTANFGPEASIQILRHARQRVGNSGGV
jgi:hypothetical protein